MLSKLTQSSSSAVYEPGEGGLFSLIDGCGSPTLAANCADFGSEWGLASVGGTNVLTNLLGDPSCEDLTLISTCSFVSEGVSSAAGFLTAVSELFRAMTWI